MTFLSSFSESTVRVAASLGVFVLFALIERLAPWREQHLGHARWWGNLGVLLVDTVCVRIVVPFTLVALATLLSERGLGILSALGWTGLGGGIVAFVALDAVIYWQHRLFHRIPVLWRLHRMHHSDTELDVSSAFRFHPLEILLSWGVKAVAILVLGPPAVAVLVFEIALNATAQFNHANLHFSPKVERILRCFIVTPNMHVIHHSAARRETDSNFAFNLPIWDHLFGSYMHQPAAGYDAMVIGLDEFRSADENRLDKLITQPFRAPSGPDKA